jgi:hypothetical protein
MDLKLTDISAAKTVAGAYFIASAVLVERAIRENQSRHRPRQGNHLARMIDFWPLGCLPSPSFHTVKGPVAGKVSGPIEGFRPQQILVNLPEGQ